MKIPKALAARRRPESKPRFAAARRAPHPRRRADLRPDRSRRPGMERHRARPHQAPLRLRARRGAHRAIAPQRRRHLLAGQILSRRSQSRAGRINLVWNRDGTPLVPSLADERKPVRATIDAESFAQFQHGLVEAARASRTAGCAPSIPSTKRVPPPCCRSITTAPLSSSRIGAAAIAIELLRTEGPAGLRLPLSSLPAGREPPRAHRRNRRRQAPRLSAAAAPSALPRPARSRRRDRAANCASATPILAGYVPGDEAEPLDTPRHRRRSRRARDQSPALRHLARIRAVARCPRARRRARRAALLQATLARGPDRHRRRQSPALRRPEPRRSSALQPPRVGHLHPALLAASSLARLSFHRPVRRLLLASAAAR